MSPRAACRLETLGFTTVYDHVAGKADWLAAGEPIDGTATHAFVGGAADRDVPTVRLDDAAQLAIAQMRASESDTAIVVNDLGVVLGRLRAGRFDEHTDQAVAAVMEEGPTTVRADTPAEELLDRMRARAVEQVIVTRPQGHLIGLVRREDVEQSGCCEPECGPDTCGS